MLPLDQVRQPAAPFTMSQLFRFRKAIAFARRAHDGLDRPSGRAYFSHALAVLQILLSANKALPEEAYIAALLHDTIEHGNATKEEIALAFGEEVAAVVAALTHPVATKAKDHLALQELYVAQIVEANTVYPYIMLITMADRLHNLETAQFLPKKAQQSLIEEVTTLYLPIFLREEFREDISLEGHSYLSGLVQMSLSTFIQRKKSV